jgi:hypothetical protein
MKYRPSSQKSMSLEEAGSYLSKLKAEGKARNIVIGTKAPAGDVRWMTDFPGLSTFMAINPALKHEAARYIPNFDPGRDLSTHLDVPAEQFKTIDVIELKPDSKDIAKIERIKITGGKRAPFKPGQYLNGLGRVTPYMAIGAIGADLAQSGIRGVQTLLSKALSGKLKGKLVLRPSKKNPRVKRWQKPMDKAASAGAAAWGTTKALAPGLAAGTAAGFLIESAVNKALPMSKVKDKGKIERTAYIEARRMAASLPASLIGSGVALMASPHLVGRIATTAMEQGRADAGAIASLFFVTLWGAAAGSTAAINTDMVRRGMPAQALSPLNVALEHPELKAEVDKNPQLATLLPLATFAAAPIALVYFGKKYYPGSFMASPRLLLERVFSAIEEYERSLGGKTGAPAGFFEARAKELLREMIPEVEEAQRRETLSTIRSLERERAPIPANLSHQARRLGLVLRPSKKNPKVKRWQRPEEPELDKTSSLAQKAMWGLVPGTAAAGATALAIDAGTTPGTTSKNKKEISEFIQAMEMQEGATVAKAQEKARKDLTQAFHSEQGDLLGELRKRQRYGMKISPSMKRQAKKFNLEFSAGAWSPEKQWRRKS